MKLPPHKSICPVGRGSRRASSLVGRRSVAASNSSQRGVALVITLLMLSVITFLAVAFLAMTRRDTSAKTATLDVTTSQSMSETALARAEAEIMARMMAQTDILAYDYMASQDFINTAGYTAGLSSNNYNNVNYDFQFVSLNNGVLTIKPWPTPVSTADWARNIANLWYDPRPPVFINTNTDPRYVSNDFRYYVDLNRDGMFEGTTYRTTDFQDNSKFPVAANTSGQPGEPEWIGVLADPSHPHSPSNYFIGRFAYLVLPIGKTLDINFSHNESQSNYNHPQDLDLFARDQGVGSWELNLAAYLRDLNTNSYENPFYVITGEQYDYNLPNLTGGVTVGNRGYCFDDALFITSNRLRGAATMAQDFNDVYLFRTNGIDDFGSSPEITAAALEGYNSGRFGVIGAAPFEFDSATDPDSKTVNALAAGNGWPGSYLTNYIYDMQDVFDAHKTGGLAGRLARAGGSNGWSTVIGQNSITYDRYTYQRMLTSMGTSSQPDNAVFVFPDGITTNVLGTNTLLLPRMNLNYDNSVQLALGAAGVYAPMPTNPVPWTDPVKFFTNCANLLLRTQEFPVTNYYLSELNNTNIIELHHFGIGSMLPYYPIYCPTNYSYRYTAQLHRMLQLAANLYDATVNTNWFLNGTNVVHFPSVFRPICEISNNCLYIVGYSNVSPLDVRLFGPANPLQAPWYYPTNILPGVYRGTLPALPIGVPLTEVNFYGVPWVVGAVKGLPSFDKISQVAAFGITRKLEFVRTNPGKPNFFQTNQLYEFMASNHFGVDLWNSYQEPFQRPVVVYASNATSIFLTNNSTSKPYGRTWYYDSVTNFIVNTWPGFSGNRNDTTGKSFIVPLLNSTNFLPLQSYLDDIPGSGFPGLIPPIDAWDFATYTEHGWTLGITNTLWYVMQDRETGAVLDFVNTGPVGSYMNITNLLMYNQPPTHPPVAGAGGSSALSYQLVWNPANPAGNSDAYPGYSPQYFTTGASNQILIGKGYFNVQDWNPTVAHMTPADFSYEQQTFAAYLLGGAATNTTMGDPFQPTTVFAQMTKWEANDPLVHYTLQDLTPPTGTSNYVSIFNPSYETPPLPDHLGQVNDDYAPWNSGARVSGNEGFEDPEITNSDAWYFPTNKFPSVGWVGRVHRGTPWQTVYLKADPYPASTPQDPYDNPACNPYKWVNQWVGDLSPGLPWPGASYPTNDWRLLDLFTTAPNDNALRGTLSVNQTNTAAWHALLDGVVVLTNDPNNGVYGMLIDPNTPYGTNANAVDYIVGQINALRATQTNGVFHSIGQILQIPALTTASPYIDWNDRNGIPRDEVVERIPQQIGSLLKLGEPQFVIYAWGQSLRPQSFYNPGPLGGLQANSASLFKLCTNYSITGEFLTRTVCHLDLTKSDPFGQHPKLQVDSFNIIPAAQ